MKDFTVRDEFNKKGFLKIERFIDESELFNLKAKIKKSEEYKSFFINKENYIPSMSKSVQGSTLHFINYGTLLKEWIESLHLRNKLNFISDIVGCNLVRINDNVFESATEVGAGLNWHVDYCSFSYSEINKRGVHLWIPLDPITKAQRGGLKLISKEKLNGDFMFQFAEFYFDAMAKNPSSEDYKKIMMADDYLMNKIPEYINSNVPSYYIEEPTFNVGDALLFDKSVAHKTAEFITGELETRMALVIRFIDADSEFNSNILKKIIRHLKISSSDPHFTISDPFLSALESERSGIKISDSNLIRDNIEFRMLPTFRN